MKTADEMILAHPDILAKREITIFGVIMDRSGSMLRYGDVPRTAINKHIQVLQAHPNADSAFGFVMTFSDTARFDIEPQPLNSMPTLGEYKSEGNTMLYATVFVALKALLERKTIFEAKGLKVNLDLAVFTDGDDNLSQDMREQLVSLAGEALEAGAHLNLVAIGMDKLRMASEMGFPPQDAVQLARNASAIGQTMIGVTRRTYTTMTGFGRSAPSTPVPPSSH